jgi:hypothetical protein
MKHKLEQLERELAYLAQCLQDRDDQHVHDLKLMSNLRLEKAQLAGSLATAQERISNLQLEITRLTQALEARADAPRCRLCDKTMPSRLDGLIGG